MVVNRRMDACVVLALEKPESYLKYIVTWIRIGRQFSTRYEAGLRQLDYIVLQSWNEYIYIFIVWMNDLILRRWRCVRHRFVRSMHRPVGGWVDTDSHRRDLKVCKSNRSNEKRKNRLFDVHLLFLADVKYGVVTVATNMSTAIKQIPPLLILEKLVLKASKSSKRLSRETICGQIVDLLVP